MHRNLRGILDKLPKTLDETYERVLKDINEDNRDHARRLLHCLAVAIRPLRVEELAEILAFDFDGAEGGIPKFHADWRSKDQERALLSACSSLLTVVDSDQKYFGKCRVVQFSHFSVKEFLVSDRLASSAGDVSRYHILPGPAHTILAQACLGFLLHLDIPTSRQTRKRFPLARYAAEHWVAHAQFEDVVSHVKDGMQSLFDPDKHHLVAWLGIYDIDNSPTDCPPNPLYYAALCGFRDLVEHLVTNHPNLINAVGGRYDFPMFAALSKKHIRVAEFLLEHGGRVDIRGADGLTPLQKSFDPDWCVREEITYMVSFLLRHGADVNVRGSGLFTPLHTAIWSAIFEVVRLLLESGADVNSRDYKGRTPLLYVDKMGFLEDEVQVRDMTHLLLEHGANVNAQDRDGVTPLIVAVSKRCPDVLRILLEHGADPNVKNSAGENPLHRVIASPYADPRDCSIVRLLLEHGANVNDQDKRHTTPLHLAMKWRSCEMAQILLDHNAQPDMVNNDGKTPLHLALKRIYSSHYSSDEAEILTARSVRLLLDRGANVNAQDKRNTTPLHLAVKRKMYDITRILLARGAEPNVKSNSGKTPLHQLLECALSNYDVPDLARLLLDHGADVNSQDRSHATPLLLATKRNMDDVALILHEYGADPNVMNIRGQAPLHPPLQRYSHDRDDADDVLIAERLLLERGAEVNVQNEDNSSPLYRHQFQLNITSEGENNS